MYVYILVTYREQRKGTQKNNLKWTDPIPKKMVSTRSCLVSGGSNKSVDSSPSASAGAETTRPETRSREVALAEHFSWFTQDSYEKPGGLPHEEDLRTSLMSNRGW